MPSITLSMCITSTFDYTTKLGADITKPVEAIEAEIKHNPKLWLERLGRMENTTVTWRAELAR